MDLENCKYCGKVFIVHQRRQTCCVDCKVMHDGWYKQVRELVKRTPGCTIMDIHQKTGIPVATVLELTREEYYSYSY